MNEKKITLLRRFNSLLNVVIYSFIGVFIGHAIYVYWEYRKYPGLYAMQSAPWYTSIIVYGLGAAVVSLISVVLKCIIKKKLKSY